MSARVVLLLTTFAMLASCGTPRETPTRAAAPQSAREGLIAVVPAGSPFHGVHGIRFDADDNLYAASVIGQSIYTVDVDTGDVSTLIGPPEGMGDDIAFAADGTMVWTAIENGILYARSPDGAIRRVLEGYRGVNAVSFARDGRTLYLTLVFYGDALYEVDIYGDTPPRLISAAHGGLNAFEVGSDGMIYGPLVFGGSVVRIDPATGAREIVSDEFVSPGALKLESDATALVLDDGAQIKRVELASGATSLLATLPAGADNLAVDSTGRIFVSLSETNAIVEIDARSGEVGYIVAPAPLNSPAGFAVDTSGGSDTLYIGDLFGGIKVVDAGSGAIEHRPVELFQPTHIAVTADDVIAVSEVSGTVQRLAKSDFRVLDTWDSFITPADVLVHADGTIVVAETAAGTLEQISPDGVHTVIASGLQTPRGLAWAGPNAVYVTESSAGAIARVELASGVVMRIASGLARPEGLAIDRDGSVLVVEVDARRLSRVEPVSGTVTAVAQSLPIGHALGPSLYRDVAVGIGGIYLNSDVDNTVYRLVGDRGMAPL
jgi:sugar lactone lactonase YvrE